MVCGHGDAVRLEPSDGPSADVSGTSDVRFIRDDVLFRAALLGLGVLGVIHSCWVRVQAPLLLCEDRYPVSFSEALRLLDDEAWLRHLRGRVRRRRWRAWCPRRAAPSPLASSWSCRADAERGFRHVKSHARMNHLLATL